MLSMQQNGWESVPAKGDECQGTAPEAAEMLLVHEHSIPKAFPQTTTRLP